MKLFGSINFTGVGSSTSLRKKMTNAKGRKWAAAAATRFLTLNITFACCLVPAITQMQKPIIPNGQKVAVKPVSLAHLYWHFLIYQQHLDEKAQELTAQGRDTSLMHSYLQQRSGLSDVEFAPIRISGIRLKSEIKTLDDKAQVIRSAELEPTRKRAELQMLSAKREAYIKAEIIYLKRSLPPTKVKQLESFLISFFSPANASPRPPFVRRNVQPSSPQP